MKSHYDAFFSLSMRKFYILARQIYHMQESKQQEILKLLDEVNAMTKTEQHFLVILRIRGKIPGCDSMDIYKDRQFFKCMNKLIAAKWVKKRISLNRKTNRYNSSYTLTSKGIKFNAMMMQHPIYKPVWDKMEHRIAIGERII
jgi:hypothetical protein